MKKEQIDITNVKKLLMIIKKPELLVTMIELPFLIVLVLSMLN